MFIRSIYMLVGSSYMYMLLERGFLIFKNAYLLWLLNGRRNHYVIIIWWKKLEKPVAKHFNSMGHSLEDLSIYVIEKIHREEATFRKAKESHWIQTLRTLAPEGLNLES